MPRPRPRSKTEIEPSSAARTEAALRRAFAPRTAWRRGWRSAASVAALAAGGSIAAGIALALLPGQPQAPGGHSETPELAARAGAMPTSVDGPAAPSLAGLSQDNSAQLAASGSASRAPRAATTALAGASIGREPQGPGARLPAVAPKEMPPVRFGEAAELAAMLGTASPVDMQGAPSGRPSLQSVADGPKTDAGPWMLPHSSAGRRVAWTADDGRPGPLQLVAGQVELELPSEPPRPDPAIPVQAAPAPAIPADSAGAEAAFLHALEIATDDPRTAVIDYARAALLGHGRAALYLGQIYETGDGVPVDFVIARHWYEVAAPANPHAQRRLSELPQAEPGELVPPIPLLAQPAGGGADDFIWTSGAGADPLSYVVQLGADPKAGAIAAYSARRLGRAAAGHTAGQVLARGRAGPGRQAFRRLGVAAHPARPARPARPRFPDESARAQQGSVEPGARTQSARIAPPPIAPPPIAGAGRPLHGPGGTSPHRDHRASAHQGQPRASPASSRQGGADPPRGRDTRRRVAPFLPFPTEP